MFDKKKYITSGAKSILPDYIQTLIWYMIEIMPAEEKDHLQVFNFEETILDGQIKQKILHTQEAPTYSNEHVITVNRPITCKVYVIDGGDHCTMLLSNEY